MTCRASYPSPFGVMTSVFALLLDRRGSPRWVRLPARHDVCERQVMFDKLLGTHCHWGRTLISQDRPDRQCSVAVCVAHPDPSKFKVGRPLPALIWGRLDPRIEKYDGVAGGGVWFYSRSHSRMVCLKEDMRLSDVVSVPGLGACMLSTFHAWKPATLHAHDVPTRPPSQDCIHLLDWECAVPAPRPEWDWCTMDKWQHRRRSRAWRLQMRHIIDKLKRCVASATPPPLPADC